ncbi:environmental stress-induced protein Ves [Agrobacterium vitis]|nr:environmental stress-induced protein Ves [Agrobacterium vitis]MBE1439091.1 environmental stress-induced protein Ves [Agrobacterium vitis]
MQIIARDHYTRMPWKNGKGLTEEIMAFPVGSTMETFDWRLSIAHVGVDGPFSVFPGVDRSIALLDGEGLRLDLPDRCPNTLAPYGQPFAFPGEWVISSTNIGGPTMDLNIMTRRGRYQHHMRRHRGAGPLTIDAKSQTLLVFKHAATIETAGTSICLAAWTSMALETGENITITAKDPLHVLIIELQPVEQGT